MKRILTVLLMLMMGSLPAWAALASPANVGPQASTSPESAAGPSGLITLRGNTRPEANAKNDRGRVSDDLVLNHLMLQLRRSPEREQALQQFISALHDPTSPLFHQWITAAEFGQRYGAAPSDVAQVTDWLESQGFTVNRVYPNQMVVDFTGSAGQIREAFHTEIHNLVVKGQAHIANMSDPQIPAELAATVAGVVSLNDFRPRPMFRPRANSRPNYTFSCGTDCTENALVPADLATIYNFNPAFTAGITGQGQTIVVLEDSDLYATSDYTTFRSVLGLSGSGTLTTVNPGGCDDPGVNSDDVEAALDAEWASAAAPSAAIELASCADTGTTTGQFIALQNLLASGTPPAIVSDSYGESESDLGAAGNLSMSSLYQQAVTAGVSLFIAAGDEGAATTDYDMGDESYTYFGISVNGLASTPYNVAVGGTDFADTYQNTNTTYWNSSSNNSGTYGSARSYIPEIPWNDSCASVIIGDYAGDLPTYGSTGLCNETNYFYENYNYEFLNTSAGGGGPSACATGVPDYPDLTGVSGTCAGYPKPSWQSLYGNPSDGVRDLPDVSIFGSDGYIWGHYYVMCYSDPTTGYGGAPCSGAPDTWAGGGGTSFASPIWAGIQALINQASGSRWGNPNPAYYALAATEYGSSGSTTCKSNVVEAGNNCAFYDVTQIPLLYTGTGTGGDTDLPCSGMNCYLPGGTYGVLSTFPQTLSSVIVTNLGSGYTGLPSCTLSGGGGSGATCSTFSTGVVLPVTPSTPLPSPLNFTAGSGYSSGAVCTLTGGGGTGATCEADTYNAEGLTCGNNSVCAVLLDTYGSGYTSAPTCTITPFNGGAGSGASCTASEGPGIAASVNSAGSGYTSLPGCILSGGGGTGALCAALAVNTSNGYIPAFNAGPGWDFATGIGSVNVSNLVSSFTSVTVSPASLTFGNQSVGTPSAASSVTVTNNGSESLTFTNIAVTGNFGIAASGTTCNTSTPVAAHGSCVINVTFTPTATGSLSGNLTLTDNATLTVSPYGTPQMVSLSGTGTQTGIAISSVIPSSVTLVQGASAQVVTVDVTDTNYTGSVTLSTSTLPSGVTATITQPGTGSSGSISLQAASNAALVTNQTITITASGSGVSSVTSTFSLTVSAGPSIAISSVIPSSVTLVPGGTQVVTVNLTDTNYTGSVTLSTSTLPTGVTATITQPGTSSSGSISLQAASNAPVATNQTITITASGSGVSSVNSTFSLTVTSAPSITISSVSPPSVTLLQGGSSQAVNVNLTDTNYTGSVTLSTSTLPSGVTATFTQPGTGNLGVINLQAASNAAVVSNQTITITATGTGVSATNTFNLTVNSVAPVAGVSPSSLTFSNQNAGTTSAAQMVTLSNTGNAALNISAIGFAGANASSFAVASTGTTCSTTSPVAASASCTISVTFTPTTTGSLTGTLTITDNSNGTTGSTQTVSLSGTGTGPVAGVSPTTLTFSAQTLTTTSTTQPVTLSNTGAGALTVASITASTNFGQTNNCGTSVAASSSCTINVTFTPTTTGSLTGTLTITDNSNGVAGSTQTVQLSGTGQDFSVPTPGTSSNTVAPGATATYGLTVNAVNGYSGTVTFTCTGAPSGAVCTVSPNPYTVGSTPSPTVSVTTTAPSLSAPRSRPLPPLPPLSPVVRGLWMLALVLSAMAWAIWRRNQPGVGRWKSTMIPLAAGVMLILALAGCGGGGSSSPSPPSNPGTPAGTYTLTVTGTAGSDSHSVTLTLVVS
jgi:hypothetical protein